MVWWLKIENLELINIRSMKYIIAFFACALAVVSTSGEILTNPAYVQWYEDQNRPLEGEETYVTIKNGTIVGTTFQDSVNNATIYAYLGIPYAKPPVGQLRFKPPQEADAWEGVLDGTQHPPACAQFLTNLTVAQEDCLFLSVYTRRNVNTTGQPLPVMFWIHGGGFLLGQTSYYDAKKLLAEEVVLVTVQYRLGPLGFLSTGDDLIPANNGMKDMVLGLKWVQENIAAFGGDPNQVTIFGESAGGASAIFLLTSPLTKGLFSRVAAISGTSLAEWSVERRPLETMTKISEFLECDTTNTTTMYNCLMQQEWGYISQAHFYVLIGEQGGNLKALIPGASVVVEGNIPGAFMPEEPLAMLEKGELPNPDAQVLLGANQQEGSFVLAAAYLLKLGHGDLLNDTTYVNDHLIGDLLATWNIDDSMNGGSISQALALGFLPPGPRTNFTAFTYELIDMVSVLFMKAPILRTAEILSRRLPAVYLYSFEHYGELSLYTTIFDLMREIVGDLLPIPPFAGGITHADDIMYMFTQPTPQNAADAAFSQIWCKFFTNFAATGTPTPTATPQYPLWPAFTLDNHSYMKVTASPSVQQYYPASWQQGTPLKK